MDKISRDDPRAGYMAEDRTVDRDELFDFVRDKHRWVLATTRADGRPQLSLVTGGLIADGRLAPTQPLEKTSPESVASAQVLMSWSLRR